MADIETVRTALATIDSGDRDTRLRMGFALHNEFGDSGFALWDEWSRTWAEYRERDVGGVEVDFPQQRDQARHHRQRVPNNHFCR